MVIADLDVVGIAVDEAETDSPLIVYGDRVLAFSVSGKRMESVTRRYLQVLWAGSQIQVLKLARGPFRDVRRKPFCLTCSVVLLGTSIRERFDHRPECNASRDGSQLLERAHKRSR